MALALIVLCIILGKRPEAVEETEPKIPSPGCGAARSPRSA